MRPSPVSRTAAHLVPDGLLDEAEQHLVRVARLLRLGPVVDAHHLLHALREQGGAAHLGEVVLCLVPLLASEIRLMLLMSGVC